MREVEYTNRFLKDLQMVSRSSRYAKVLEHEFDIVLDLLMHDKNIPEKYCDHGLTGN